jgi:putative ABC transport system substrate-binding protein
LTSFAFTSYPRLLAAAVAAWPRISVAQQSARIKRLGILTLLSQRNDPNERISAFIAGLSDLGYVPRRTIEVDYRFADGDTDRLPSLARELIALAPDLIFAAEPSAARAVQSITPDLPILCPALTDRVADLFGSYARPLGNVTGITNNVEGLSARLVGISQEVIPDLARIGLLLNPAGASRELVREQVRTAAQARKISTVVEEARSPDELAPALGRMMKAEAQIIIVPDNGLFINNRAAIIANAFAARLPTVFQQRTAVEQGALLSYGGNAAEASLRAAKLADKILRGARPGDLPIEFPARIELVINLRTAKELNLTIPQSLLVRADEVIE